MGSKLRYSYDTPKEEKLVGPKPGRNQPCTCGSGKKYKFCCIGRELKPRIVPVTPGLHAPGAPATVDLTGDIMNHFSGIDRALHFFCREHDFYLFGTTMTVGKLEEFIRALEADVLTKSALIDYYKSSTKQDAVVGLIEDACGSFDSFKPRRKILLDAVNAHFRGLYTLSVPAMFAQIEGIMRDIGALAPKDDLKPTIKRDWDNRTLFGMSDDAAHFNAFLHQLFEGQKGADEFNRNPILHGANVGYDTEENSLVLILILLEIRTFLWFEKNTSPLV